MPEERDAPEKCPVCDGTGKVGPKKDKDCGACGGDGKAK